MQLIRNIQSEANPVIDAPWFAAMVAAVGREHVFSGVPDRIAYSRDRLPLGNFHYRAGSLVEAATSAIVRPGSVEEVQQVVRIARAHGVATIPYGLGSGVLGGTVPLGREIMIDLKRLNRILSLDREDGLVTVQAGMNGGQFEAALDGEGMTSGHYPQSINISSVGGWAACRGAGQASARYGKIEDMVAGLKVVLPDGALLDVRPVPRRAVGPSIKDIFVGAEGTLGIIVELTLKIWPKPAVERLRTLAFPSYGKGLEALRMVMQAELRPSVIRLYDALESAPRTSGVPGFERNPVLCVLSFSGHPELVDAEERITLEICRRAGAVEADNAPAEAWRAHRFHSYSPQVVASGGIMDTIEIAARWSAIPTMYEEMRAAVAQIRSDCAFSAHWSHVYSDGACMYMTFKLPPGDEEGNWRDHGRIWEAVMRSCLDHGGTISHHHGVGYFRNAWIAEELNEGHRVLRSLKQSLDPDNLMNPGKLGL